ncbi:major facilitator superfamily protein [Halosimplex carlsbadense 2-9-1]|uniref:Major facilitator superfamily protein n=1 Tax=Halosimplex carlsbadense 2-9-1 TaxID=797114 RepID=M0CNY2_9EURY|nr:MFS transporter [Halosimplex carlsbadense]ELZ24951.1 major facilitator superfamily protein [Halosimplex carlsbadense 2-9-1]
MNRNDRAITGFAMAAHGLVHTYELAVPILLTVWIVEFPVTSATLGTVVAVGYGLFGVGALPAGLLVDRFGSRALVVGCTLGMGLSFLLLSVLPGVVGIAVALALWGVAASVYHPAGLTLISKGVEERGVAFAYHGMAGNVGIVAGPFLTALLLVVVDWRVAVAALSVPALVATVVGLRAEFDETAAVGRGEAAADGGGDAPETDIGSLSEFVSASRAVFTLGFLTVFALVMFNGLYYRGMLTFLPGLLSDFLEPLVGSAAGSVGPFSEGPAAAEFDRSRYLYAGLLAVGIGGQYVGGRLTDAVEPERGLVIALSSLAAIAVLFVPASGSLPALLAVSVALGFTLFGMQPLTQATIAKYSPPEHRGLSFGYTYLAIFGIGALGASITGWVLTYGSPPLLFLTLAGFAAAALGLAVSLVLRDR